MIPRKSKRKNLEMTIEEMINFATAYVEKEIRIQYEKLWVNYSMGDVRD